MGANTKIEWCDVTDNIIKVKNGGFWCRKISADCDNCYAEKLNQNPFFTGNRLPYLGASPELVLVDKVLDGWKFQRKPKTHFVSSMTDVFGEFISVEFQMKFLDSMTEAPLQTFLILTKRSDILLTNTTLWLKSRHYEKMPDNIWVGCSIENPLRLKSQASAIAEVPGNRFWSLEPLLEDLGDISSYLSGVDWIILGGESGPNARICNINWFRSIIKQAKKGRIPVFVKQLGECPYESDESWQMFATTPPEPKFLKLNSKKGGDISEFPQDLRLRQFPKSFKKNTADLTAV
jgi:protein gp37